MNKAKLKKYKEKQVLRKFLEYLNDDELSFRSFSCTEAPDFIHRNERLGIELTEYCRDLDLREKKGSKLKEIENLYKEIAFRAKTKFSERNPGKRMDVAMYPVDYRRNEFIFQPKEIENIAGSLVELIEFNIGQELEIDSTSLDRPLAKYLSYLDLYPSPDYQQSMHWLIVQAVILEVITEAIDFLIKEKERKLPNYKDKATHNWLIVYSDHRPCLKSISSGSESSCGIITNELKQHVFYTNFNKVFYLDGDSRELLELQIQNRL